MNRLSSLADHVLPLVLTGIALSGWASTYDGNRWLVVGLLGAALAGFVAAWLAARGWGSDVLVLVLIPLYLLTAAPVASVAYDDALLGTVLGGTVDSWTLLAGSHPFVPAEGVLVLPPYLVGLVSGGLATSLALRSRSPGVPVLVPLAAFVVVQVLGREQPDWVAATAFACTAVAWIVLRELRLEVRAGPVALVTRLGMAAALVAVAAAWASPVADLVEPAAGSRVLLRDVAPAYDVADVRTPLESFRRYTEPAPGALGNLHDRELLTVRGLPAGTRLRFAALDVYDWKEWHADDKTVAGRHDDRFLRVDGSLDNPATGEEHFVNVEVEQAWDDQWVPTAGAVQWFGFDGSRADDRLENFRYNPATRTGVMTGPLTPSDSYEFSTVLTDDRLTRGLAPSPLLDRDTFILAKFVDLAALAWSQGATSPIDGVLRAAEVMRTTGRYSDGAVGYEQKYHAGHNRQRIGEEFIGGSLTGNDEQYAATMALIATRLHVPARVVVGAVLPPSGVVRGRDVSAWVELRVADGSWRVLPTQAFMGSTPPEVDRFQTNPDPDLQLPPGTDLKDHFDYEPPTYTEREERRAARVAEEEGSGWWWKLPLALLAAVVLLLVVALLAAPVLKWRRRRARLGAPRVTLRYAGAWLELVDLARDLGVAVPRGLTRPAEAAAMGRGAELAAEADRVIFGTELPDPAAAEAFAAAVAAEARGLRAAAPWHRRLLRPFRPASLRRRRSARGLRDRLDLRADREGQLAQEG